MASKRELARRLADVDGFDDPSPALEQYLTPPALAASLVHLADLRDDLDRTVLDLGAGTGMLAIGAALRSAPRVIALDRDPGAVATGRANANRIEPPVGVEWLLGDAARAPVCTDDATVLSNPPFGAQAASEGDRPFLETAARVATVSYSIHNHDSHGFVDAFAADNGGTITDAYASEITLDRQFPFHDADRREIPVEVFRIEWNRR